MLQLQIEIISLNIIPHFAFFIKFFLFALA